MWARREDPWDDLLARRALEDAGMWVLLPLALSLGGGFVIFISIFAGEPQWNLLAGAAAALLGLTSAALMYHRGGIVALVLIAVGASGGWVWEQFRDRASIDAAHIGGTYDYLGVGYDGGLDPLSWTRSR